MFSTPTRPRTTTKTGFKNILAELRILLADRTKIKIPTAIMAKDKNLLIISATLKTSNASVPVVSLKTGALLGM